MSQTPGTPPAGRETDFERWNLIIKAAGAVATIATVAVSVAVFLSQRSEQIAQRDLEISAIGRQSQQKFLDKQYELYFETVSLVSKLAIQSPNEFERKDLNRFWQLYWGQLGMVEDRAVERAMVFVGKSLGARLDGKNRTCAEIFNLASLLLAHAVRLSLERNWGIDVPDDEKSKAAKRRNDEDFGRLAEACKKASEPANDGDTDKRNR